MFPGYRNMDPYTQHLHHQWEHIPPPYHYYPNWEPRPIHMKTDSFNHPSACGPCPYNNQVEHDSCCNRSYPTGYCSFRPPYFHYQHPPQMYYHGPYPSYQNAYPPLFIPPHFDRARCDYDLDKNHCCGCPNHNSHRKEGSNVKIEEQNTSPVIDEGPATTPKGNHGSLIQFPYNYYPMMWHPENSTRDGKTEKKTESLPMLNFKDNLKDLRQGQGESTNQGDSKVLQLPCPIFWLPGNGKPEEPVKDKKEIDATPKVAEDWPSKLKIVPLKLLGNENVVEKPGVLEEETKTQHSEKESKIKTIPVMHLDSSSGEKLSMADRPEDVLKNSVTEEKKHDAEIKKGGKKQPSPQKSSKLPPVCLRVEPLPKKNGSNGKGRSPSLLSLKDKVKPHEGNLGDAAIMNKDSDNTTKDIKVIDVEYQPSGEGGKDTAAAISGQDMKGIEEQCGEKDRNVVTTEVGVQVKGNVGGNKEEREEIPISQQRMIQREREKVDTSDYCKKQVQKKYSPEDAALLIQSAFRGFNVRRWKPLDKLQKIAQIRGKLNDVKSQIQNYEGSLELDVKQKVIISETIMNLLLQLDTIQGLLPSLRDIRKSVARDLVSLQDKLDQLYVQATNEHEEGTQKKDESSSSTSYASEITSTPEEKDLPSAGSHMKEKILSEQPSQYLKVENEFLQESEGSPMACQHDSAVSDKISDAVLEDAVKEPVGQSHIIPLKVLNDEIVPFGERAPQHEDETDRQADNLSSAEGNASMFEKYLNQDVVANVALPPESRVLDFGMKQQPDSDHTKWKEMQALKEQDLNDVECDSKHENPSISLLEEQIRNEEFMAVKPNEANKQSLFEVVALKEKSESKKEANSDEGATIKPEDVNVIRNDEALEEKSNVVGDSFVVSEELKAAFKHAGEGDRSEEYQLEPDSLAAMYPIQSSDAWKEETQSVKEDNEMSEYSKTEAKLCVKSAAIDTAVHKSELAEASSEIPAAETSIIASTDKVGVDSLGVFKSGAMNNESVLLEASVCDTGLKETASYSINAIDSESNSKDSSQETRSCTQHGKSLPGDFVNGEIISEEKKIVEDNEKLRQMLEKLLNAGQEQMGVIAELNERVKNLEKKLSKRKKVKVNQKKLNKSSHVVVGKDKEMSYEKEATSAA